MGLMRLFVILLCALTLTIGSADAKKKKCNKLCKNDIKACRTDCGELKGKAKRKCKAACKKDSLKACAANPDPNDCVPPTTTTTTSTNVPSSTTSTTLPPYGSASRAFLDRVSSLLD
jgi:hypothetical protein